MADNATGATNMAAENILTKDQTEELARLKAYFPYRIVFGVIRKDTGAFEAWCKPTMAVANRLAREGHTVLVFGRA